MGQNLVQLFITEDYKASVGEVLNQLSMVGPPTGASPSEWP